ncbi:CLUMA_CG017467, isoform A [Clunio marinus]|uniref:CLUMA_CG017467, isoform A n=1 Tax=Clunio marinus TaxID=568069 RepID=A0A1J1IW26_9DIPT|nr:CLUMA_CG017467, isoform A [Clunio marinus]
MDSFILYGQSEINLVSWKKNYHKKSLCFGTPRDNVDVVAWESLKVEQLLRIFTHWTFTNCKILILNFMLLICYWSSSNHHKMSDKLKYTISYHVS